MKTLVVAIASLCLGSIAHATTFTFDEYEVSGTTINALPDPYTVDGFSLSGDSLTSLGQGFLGFYAGSAGAFSNVANGSLSLVRTDGLTFNVFSIDLSYLLTNGGPTDVTFTGTVLGGGTVSQTVSVTGFGFQTFTLTGFMDLLAFSWDQGTTGIDAHQFDNIVAAPVPLPGALGYFACGLVGLVGLKRKRPDAIHSAY